MKIKLLKLDTLCSLLGNFSEEKLPIKLSYKIMKVLSSMENELQFYQNKLQELIQEYALRDENNSIVYIDDGENIKIQEDKIEDFNIKYHELLDMEVEIEDFTFSLDELENLKLSPKELYILQDFIKE